MNAPTTIFEARSPQWAVSGSVIDDRPLRRPAVLAVDAGGTSQTATVTYDPDRRWPVPEPVSRDPEPAPTLTAGAR